MNLFGDHLLSVITFTPLAGAVLLMAIPAFKRNDDAVRWVANIFGVLGFLVSLPLWLRFDRAAAGFQFIEKAPWIPTIGASYPFDVTQWYTMAPGLPFEFQKWVFLAFFLGFAIKVPMFPFHTWLPDAHVQAPTAGSVILAGVLLKMGTYGFIRFSLPLLPAATLWAVPWMVTLSIIGIVYAALVTL